MPTTVGLDIGRTAVRAVELRPGRRASVRRSGRVPLPLGAVEGGSVADPGAVTEALRGLWKETRISNTRVRLGVCSGSVLVRQIELDWMPPADLRRALRYQVADLLPVSIDDANIDHVHLGEHEAIDPATGATRRMVKILLIATARGAVDELVHAVRAAGLRPVTADLSPLALVRAAAVAASRFPSAADDDEAAMGVQRTEAVVDVGADKVSVAVHTGGVPRFVRVAPGIGGESFTRAIVEATGLDWTSAEEAKTALSRTGSHTAPAGDESAVDLLAVRRAVREATERLVLDIRTTLDFHAGTDPDHVPTRAVITGGGARHADFLALCSRHLSMPVTQLDPRSVASLRGGDDDEPGTTPLADDDLLVSLGLCLGATA